MIEGGEITWLQQQFLWTLFCNGFFSLPSTIVEVEYWLCWLILAYSVNWVHGHYQIYVTLHWLGFFVLQWALKCNLKLPKILKLKSIHQLYHYTRNSLSDLDPFLEAHKNITIFSLGAADLPVGNEWLQLDGSLKEELIVYKIGIAVTKAWGYQDHLLEIIMFPKDHFYFGTVHCRSRNAYSWYLSKILPLITLIFSFEKKQR